MKEFFVTILMGAVGLMAGYLIGAHRVIYCEQTALVWTSVVRDSAAGHTRQKMAICDGTPIVLVER